MRPILVAGLFIFAWLQPVTVLAQQGPDQASVASPSSPEADRPVRIPEMPANSDQLNPSAYFVRSNSGRARIEGLDILDDEVPIVLFAKDSAIKPTIAIRGVYKREGWRLFGPDGKQPLPTEFTIYAHLRGRVNEIEFTAVGPSKERQKERVYIYAPNARTFYVVSAWENILFSAGLSGFSYSQTGFGVYESINATAAVRYGSPDTDSFMTFVGSAEMMVLALASSPVSTAPQLLEIKADLSLRTNKRPMQRIRHRVLVGGTYVTMFSNGSPFGFSDLMAFEAGLQSRYIASSKVDWIFEVRYVPVAGFQSLGEFGYNIGIARSLLLENARRMEIGFGYTSYDYQALDTIRIQTSLVSLRIGLTL